MAAYRGDLLWKLDAKAPDPLLPRESGDPLPLPEHSRTPLSERSHHLLHTEHKV